MLQHAVLKINEVRVMKVGLVSNLLVTQQAPVLLVTTNSYMLVYFATY